MSEEDENFRWINTAKSYASHTAQFFHSFNFPEEKQVGRNLKKYPIIRLEILSAASMKNLIFVSYVIFIISLILSSFERSLRRSTENLDQIKIDKNGAMAVWNKKFSVNLNNRFFELNGFIDSFKIKSQNAQFRFDFGVDLSVISKNGEKLRNWNSSVYFGYSRYNKDKNIILVSEEKSPFGYYWQDKIFESGGSNEDLVILNIQIFLKNFSIENVDDDISIKMKFVKTNNVNHFILQYFAKF
ncbi:hypothetical protein MHBO_003972 [Bonamia ostreae]|uniref:Uncharacterized protein n=1 Tax=Bonamia ostreae TaxID=126728 RepID=A0ABV2AS15_9EUKA